MADVRESTAGGTNPGLVADGIVNGVLQGGAHVLALEVEGSDLVAKRQQGAHHVTDGERARVHIGAHTTGVLDGEVHLGIELVELPVEGFGHQGIDQTRAIRGGRHAHMGQLGRHVGDDLGLELGHGRFVLCVDHIAHGGVLRHYLDDG